MAQDNTLGSFSPYEGRIYAAFVGYFNVTIVGVKNPADQHRHLPDLLRRRRPDLEHAGAGQRRPARSADGYYRVEGRPDSARRRSPAGSSSSRQIAVDQATGTLVLSLARRPQRRRQRPGGDLHHHQHRRRQHLQRPRPTPTRRQTAIDAITGQTVVLGPQADNQSAGDGQRDATYGYGNQMGLAVYDGQVYPSGPATSTRPRSSTTAPSPATPLNI